MENLEEALSAILSDPDTMQKIQAIAGSLGQKEPSAGAAPEQQPPLPDFSGLQGLSKLASGAGVDQEQRALLKALSPYLSRDRVAKLENAMRAAKMARLASSFLGNGGLQMLTGRNRHV